MINKTDKRIRLKKRIRVKMNGTPARPRLSIFRSNKFIYAQVIDDTAGKTLTAASDVKITKGTKNERAKQVGKLIGEFCLKQKISNVVFDRNGFKYTGRIKLLADEARASGLKF
ncbi:MAG TPA: 50S ribosomal protein L18 [Candidatus Paceibacterota bacterium]|nr:50S ribosomal protein L18 [Candidatus Paceibacterota bacterium]